MTLQLYLHFPFCKRKCLYCDFCSAQAEESTIATYCRALEREIARMGAQYPQAQISTVFLGGGTPTLVPPRYLGRVLDALHNAFHILPDAEFTAEGNPGTLTGEWLDMALSHGLNRLSLGVQAAQDALLQAIGRIHSFEDARQAVALARSHGVENINLDAMFGLPEQGLTDYIDTLSAFDALNPRHISAYSLILEEGTPLYDRVEAGQVHLPDEDEVAAMYEAGIAWLENHGYQRYEVSNFAKPGCVCRHNLGYWQGVWYLGLGVAAHSMLPPTQAQRARGVHHIRRSNLRDVAAYIAQDMPPMEQDEISVQEAMFESVMLGLRTTSGVSEQHFFHQHGVTLRSCYGQAMDALAADGLGWWTAEGFALTPRGLAVQNAVLLRLMDEK